MTDADTPKLKRSWSPWLTLGLSVAVLVGVPWTMKIASAPELGEPCGGGFDCAALDGRCVYGPNGRFCTKTCVADEDCPEAAHCGVPPHDPWQLWFASSVMSERFCVPGPAPSEPLEPATAMPATATPATATSPGKEGAQLRPPDPRGSVRATKRERGQPSR